jgi:hypothetical protein
MKLFALALAGTLALISTALLAPPGLGSSSGRSANAIDPWRDANFVVTRTGRLPTGCRLRRLAQTVSSSWMAFNRGDIAKSVSLFADASGRTGQPFRVFSAIEDGTRVNASSRPSVAAFLTRRYQAGDRLHLVLLEVTPDNARSVSVYYTFALTPGTPTDLPVTRIDGKGSINCPKRTAYAWVMTPPTNFPSNAADVAVSVCPVPATWQLGSGVLVCRRATN